MAKYLNSNQLQKELFKRTESYAGNVRTMYNSALTKIINLVKGTELEDGVPFSFDAYGYNDEANKILRNLYSSVYKEIRGDAEKEWMLSNTHNDNLVKSVFGEHSIQDNHYARFFKRNQEAMDAFLNRKSGALGLDLSQKVWQYTGQYRTELEDALDLAIGEGTGANRLASQIQKYLQEPDRFYRRFRVKIGEDEDGNPKYGRIWKRRVFDKETDSYKWIDEDPKKYKSGQGVYRSSYRNAQRLARTETNIAYREADFERWQQLDFVVGIEIKLSNNHPVTDICDDLKGIYPKTFKWTGWHPNCRCYMIPVMATKEEMDDMIDKILSDEANDVESSQKVADYPGEFKQWVQDNEERMEKAKDKGTLPYFVKDNQKDIAKILKPLTPEEQHHINLVEKYGEESVQKLYSAFGSFKDKISTGDLPFQIKKLSFEVDWVAKNGKYPTSPEMVKMLEKELATVQGKYDLQLAIEDANTILSYKSKSKPLNELLGELNQVIGNGGSPKEIKAITDKAKAKIQDIEKARLSKIAKGSVSDGSTIDLYATAQEKLEIARLQDVYDKAMAQHGSQWNYEVNASYRRLADYKKDLAHKYLDKQGKIVKLNGETDDMARKALEEYLNAPLNNKASSPVGGRFQDHSSEKYKIAEYSKKTGISEDDLGLINRYTYGSKWCNNYGYGIVDSYFGKVEDYGGLCQLFYPAHNAALEKLPRFNGTVFSGIKFDPMQLDKYVTEMKACMSSGQPYINKAFMSSTTGIESTTMFGDNMMLVIKSKKGVDVKAISHYATEDEIVFRAGSKFKVLNVYKETTRKYGFGKGWVIELEEL